MKAAINFRRMGAAAGHVAIGLGRHLQQKAQRLLKRGSAPVLKHSPEVLKPYGFDDASLSDTIRLAQQGDAVAFEIIHRLYSGRVYALSLRMVHDPVEAEDLAQEAFMQVFRKLNSFRGESAFSTWLHRVAVNLVLMRLRRKVPPTVSLDATVDLDDENSPPAIDMGAPDLLLEGSVDRVNLNRCIEQLPAGYRAIFVLHDIQGYQHSEIAKMVGCSQGNSKSQLHKARMRLRELLHEVQREKARGERLASRKLNSSLRTVLPPLTAAHT